MQLKIDPKTASWWIVGVGGLSATWVSGFLASHPGAMVVVLAIYKALGAMLGPLVVQPPSPEK